MSHTPQEAAIFSYLTAHRAHLNLVGLAAQVKTSRTTLTEFLAGKRGLSAPVQLQFFSFFQTQAAQLATFPA